MPCHTLLIQILISSPSLSTELHAPWRVGSALPPPNAAFCIWKFRSLLELNTSKKKPQICLLKPAPQAVSLIWVATIILVVESQNLILSTPSSLSLKHPIHHQILLPLQWKYISPPPSLWSWPKLYHLCPGLLQSSPKQSSCFRPCHLQSILNPSNQGDCFKIEANLYHTSIPNPPMASHITKGNTQCLCHHLLWPRTPSTTCVTYFAPILYFVKNQKDLDKLWLTIVE